MELSWNSTLTTFNTDPFPGYVPASFFALAVIWRIATRNISDTVVRFTFTMGNLRNLSNAEARRGWEAAPRPQ